MNRKNKFVGFKIDEIDDDKLNQICKDNGCKKSKLIRLLIKELIEKYEDKYEAI